MKIYETGSSEEIASLPDKNQPTPSLEANLLSNFRNPPLGYGEVAFYWWMGEPLTRERISWQLDLLKDKGIAGLQVNYAHDYKGEFPGA